MPGRPMSGRVLMEVLADKRLTITTAIADGISLKDYPNIKSKVGKDIYCFFFTGLFYIMMAEPPWKTGRLFSMRIYSVYTQKQTKGLAYDVT